MRATTIIVRLCVAGNSRVRMRASARPMAATRNNTAAQTRRAPQLPAGLLRRIAQAPNRPRPGPPKHAWIQVLLYPHCKQNTFEISSEVSMADSQEAGGLMGSGVDELVLYPSTMFSCSPSSSNAGLQNTFWGKHKINLSLMSFK